MKLPKNRESGQALIMALILLALGSLLIVPGLTLATTSLKYHQLIERKTLESYSADSGVEYALTKLYNNPGGYTSEDLEESFTLNNKTVNVTAEYQGGGVYKITSTATSPNGRSTTIVAYINLSAGAFAYAIASKVSMTISNATANATDPGGANIHSNGNIDLEGPTVVDGDATAVDTISGEDKVTGMVTYPHPPVDFPGDYSELYKQMAQEGDNYTDSVPLTGGTLEDPEEFGPAYIDGNLTIGPNAFVRLTGTVYVTGTIAVKPGTYLEGEKNILAEQNVTIEGGEYVSDRIPVIISTATGAGAIYCTGGGGDNVINAVLYAPNGEVKIEGQAEVHGAVGGETVVIDNATITYAAELAGRQDLPGGELSTIAYGFS